MRKEPQRIASRDNPLLKKIRKLSHDPGAYRSLGEVWLEGDHLCLAARQAGRAVLQAVLCESASGDRALLALCDAAERLAVVPDAVFRSASGLESPGRIGFLVRVESGGPPDPEAPSVVLDRIQDPGNAGSILRSAAAFGFTQVLALAGTVSLWSPKVLRAAMGSHFALAIREGLAPGDLSAYRSPLLATAPHAGDEIGRTPLPWPCGWVLGNEGQGISAELAGRCTRMLRIVQTGGQESLNAAAAAAVCLHESQRQRTTAGS